ncbi:hypothetical protein CcaCcLH18_09999 [Colletotrichum camelliae]|nr:hypothetical protein CcaCcLH18_09999 [Colletotrichum camelliae]
MQMIRHRNGARQRQSADVRYLGELDPSCWTPTRSDPAQAPHTTTIAANNYSNTGGTPSHHRHISLPRLTPPSSRDNHHHHHDDLSLGQDVVAVPRRSPEDSALHYGFRKQMFGSSPIPNAKASYRSQTARGFVVFECLETPNSQIAFAIKLARLRAEEKDKRHLNTFPTSNFGLYCLVIAVVQPSTASTISARYRFQCFGPGLGLAGLEPPPHSAGILASLQASAPVPT